METLYEAGVGTYDREFYLWLLLGQTQRWQSQEEGYGN